MTTTSHDMRGNERTNERTRRDGEIPPTPRGERATRKAVDEERRALMREARQVWEETARKVGNPYVDSRALMTVGQQAVEATQWEDGLVILAAIREHMDPKSSPRRIPEWARLTGSDKREREHLERKREAENTPVDPQVQAALSQAWRGMRQQFTRRPADTRDVECDCGQIFKADDRRSACLSCGKDPPPGLRKEAQVRGGRMSLHADRAYARAVAEFTRTCRCCGESFLLEVPQMGHPWKTCPSCRVTCLDSRHNLIARSRRPHGKSA